MKWKLIIQILSQFVTISPIPNDMKWMISLIFYSQFFGCSVERKCFHFFFQFFYKSFQKRFQIRWLIIQVSCCENISFEASLKKTIFSIKKPFKIINNLEIIRVNQKTYCFLLPFLIVWGTLTQVSRWGFWSDFLHSNIHFTNSNFFFKNTLI